MVRFRAPFTSKASAFGASFGTMLGLAVPTLTITVYDPKVSSLDNS